MMSHELIIVTLLRKRNVRLHAIDVLFSNNVAM